MLENNINVKPQNRINLNLDNRQKTKVEAPFELANPQKITKPTDKGADSQIKQELYNYNPNSVFDKFIKLLQNSPALSETAKKIIFNKQFIENNIKSDPALSIFFNSFLKSIEMDEAEMLNCLKFQNNTYTKFQGEFFNILRNILGDNPEDGEFKAILQNFLKTYDCFISVDETNSSIKSALENIEENMPEFLKKTLSGMSDKLIFDSKNTDLNLQLLKNEMLPFISRYISKMNDFGLIKSYTSVLIHNIVRLEQSTKNILSEEIENLFDYIKYNFNFNDEQMKVLKESLISTYASSNIKNSPINSFLKLLEKGAKESENPLNKSMMEQISNTILLSRSANMPLMHMFLPVNYKGIPMFSEIWIGEEKEEKNSENYRHKKNHKAFIAFDIQGMGYFETTLIIENDTISLDVYVPGSLTAHADRISDELRALLSENNFKTGSILVQECIKARRFDEVFSNIDERKTGVDVTA